MATVPTIKGQAVIQLIEYIRNRFGEAALQKWLRLLPAEEYGLVTAKLVPVSRVPYTVFDRMYQNGLQPFGGGKGDYFIPAFEYVGERCLNTFMKFFMRLGTPAFVAHSAPLIWSHFFDTGRMVKTAGTPNSVELVAEGGEAYGEGQCYGIIGFGRMAINMSGGKNIRAEHDECVHKGRGRCFFRFVWD